MRDTVWNVAHVCRDPERRRLHRTRDAARRQTPLSLSLFIAVIIATLCVLISPALAIRVDATDKLGRRSSSSDHAIARRAEVMNVPGSTASCYASVYCAPAPNATISESSFTVRWNTYENKISTVGSVDIFLSPRSNPYDRPTLVMHLDSPPGSLGQVDIPIKPEYFSTKGQPNQTITEPMYLWILPTREKPSSGQVALPITLQMTVPAKSSPSPSPSVVVKDSPTTALKANGHDSALSTAAIIGISVGGALLLAAIIGGLFIWGVYKRRSAATAAAKHPDNRDSATNDNAVAEAGAAGASAAGVAGSSDTLNAPVSPGNLSAGDAILIAATYRQLMRKPSWKVSSGDGVDEEEEEDEEDEDGGALGPMLHRRKTGARVLMEELADEGHGLHNVNAGTAVCIDDTASAITEPARHSAASTSTPLVSSSSPPGSPKSMTR
ncbi:hypothetical protein SYNPS1DRAFT_28151 [Syncephalis pseudoplumigaleata]|uniref:Uncharacterized protein n=1 Tax=Syncephalis pseudoplumigaleata TaxID=1712513 RepID=A0A4P9Z144_9FUNG|nr:hypothetical protein SYNPS1DRAFT_28151 [Syncephalis pseudoplumigaleata]|eukprot:RKP26144.1 hypothetical protein SYNPS1DRAFT_28151 [Syncephalis pseudoplumigaleata]